MNNRIRQRLRATLTNYPRGATVSLISHKFGGVRRVHRTHVGKAGVICGKRGGCYVVNIKDAGLSKRMTVIVAPYEFKVLTHQL